MPHCLSVDEQAAQARLAALVAAYLPLKRIRSHERDVAERALGLELSRYGPFRLNDVVWQWSDSEDSIVCRPAPHLNHPPVKGQPDEATMTHVPQSSRRRCGAVSGRGQAFGGWTIKGRSI